MPTDSIFLRFVNPIAERLRARTLLLVAGLLLAGCGGGDSDFFKGSDDPFVQRTADANPLAAYCTVPRTGNDPYNNNQPYPDRQGTIDNEKSWVHAFMNDIYLWYHDIPNVDPTPYTTANYDNSVPEALDAYFQALKTPKTTASGKRVDQFSFTYSTALYNASAQSGVDIGYGMQIALLAASPPRDAVIAYTDPGTPAAAQNIGRGAQIIAVDGVAMSDGDADALNAGLFPSTAGESHSFTLQDYGSSSQRTVTLTSAAINSQPVQDVQYYDTDSGRVGYLLFNAHIATAEGELINAISTLANDNVQDLVLDMRYNGGGYLDIASELAYMIAGPARTSGKTFDRFSYNDKNPLATETDTVTPFYAKSQGFDPSVNSGTSLPTLNLSRVFVLVGPGTCSASEAVINSLEGVNVQVVLIGDTTCGKPYGFYPTDNCGLTYFAIEFSGVNDQGSGNYADGFTPACEVEDDFSHQLGDTDEARLNAALLYQSSGGCPPSVPPSQSTVAKPAPDAKALRSGQPLLGNPLKENAWIRRSH